MQERPDQSTLLDAVAQFLLAELLPKLEDKALAFRLMIAANLSTVVASELRTEDQRYAAEVRRLQAILPKMASGDGATRRERATTLAKLNRALCEALRAGQFSPEELDTVRAHLRETVRDDVSAVNPRFDLSEEIE